MAGFKLVGIAGSFNFFPSTNPALTVDLDICRSSARKPVSDIISRFKHAAEICTIVSSFTFLFALVVGVI